MVAEKIIIDLEKEWDLSSGFFGRLRTGLFDPDGFERLIKILESVDLQHEETINRRLVSLTWYIPIFMTWQRDRIIENGYDARSLELAINRVHAVLERLLGIP